MAHRLASPHVRVPTLVDPFEVPPPPPPHPNDAEILEALERGWIELAQRAVLDEGDDVLESGVRSFA